MKVFSAIAIGFSHLATLNHVEDDLAEVSRCLHTPGGKDRRREKAVLLLGIPPGCFAEFLARHVLLALSFLLLPRRLSADGPGRSHPE
jgi:hypothetical protein